MKPNKAQRRMELAFLSCLFAPRYCMAVYDSAEKLGISDATFRHADTRAAWSAVKALVKSSGQSWRDKKSSDDIAVKMAVEETVNFKDIEAARLEKFTLAAADDLIKTLVSRAELYAFREVVKVTEEQVDNCADVQTAILLARSSIARWENNAVLRNSAVDISGISQQLADGYTAAYEARKRGEIVRPIGLAWPWKILNDYYNGLRTGIHVIAARPSEGKTGIAINLSAFWRQTGVRHAFITLDMPICEAVKRYGCLETEMTDKHLSNGFGDLDEIAAFKASIDSYQDFVYLFESPEMNSIEMSIRESVHNGAKAVIIDYLQLINVKGCKNKWDAVVATTASLKQLTRELKIPFIVLAQLNRQGVRDGREPELHDIEGGGFIEQAASTVLTIGRDKSVVDQWSKFPPANLCGDNENLAKWLRPVWLNLLKHQQGAIGKFPFVMYCPFFVLRPAEHLAKPDSSACPNLPCFSSINDDWRRLSFER